MIINIKNSLLRRNVLVSMLLFIIAFFYTNSNYHFGDINHVEQLPHVFKQLNSNYLNNDFYVSYTKDVNPRFYYSLIISYVSRVIPLEIVFYVFTLLSNFLIIVTVYGIFLFFIEKILIFPTIIFGLLLSNKINLGGAGSITSHYLIPQLLAMPLILISYYFIIKGKITRVILLLIGALAIHPSLTLISFFPIMGIILVDTNKTIKEKIVHLLILIIFIAVSTLLLFPNNIANIIPDYSFIQVLAYFRHPHHYIPSTFPVNDWIDFILFACLSIASISYLRKYSLNQHVVSCLFIIYGASFVLLFIGYFFVELVPVKYIISLQTYRIIYLLKLVSYIAISSVFIVHLSSRFSKKIINMSLLTLSLVFFALSIQLNSKNNLFFPHITYDYENAKLYEFIENNTSSDSLFLTPPFMGALRVIPKRAIVVDWKSFPFNDSYILHWYERFVDCYGKNNFENNYSQITYEKLLSLQSKYHFDYAILDAHTPKIVANAIYIDKNHKIIKF